MARRRGPAGWRRGRARRTGRQARPAPGPRGRRRSAPRRPRPRSGYGKRSSEAGPRSGGPSACCARRVPPSHESAGRRRERAPAPGPRARGARRGAGAGSRGMGRDASAACSFGGHLFRPWTFQLYVGVEGGGCTGAGDRRAPDSDAAHTDGAASTTNAALSLPHINFASNQAACMVGRVDIPTGVYKRQATSPFKPPPSRAVRALRAPPWPPPWPRPWPRPPPPPPLQP